MMQDDVTSAESQVSLSAAGCYALNKILPKLARMKKNAHYLECMINIPSDREFK